MHIFLARLKIVVLVVAVWVALALLLAGLCWFLTAPIPQYALALH